MISSVRGVFRPFWAILATVLKETKVRESTHIAYWAPGIERLNTCWKRLSSSSSQSNQTELKRHFDRGCPGWLQFPQRRTTPLMRRRRGRPCGAAATSCSFLPCLSFAKQGGGKHLSSSSMFASAGSLIRSVFKTSAASMNYSYPFDRRCIFLCANEQISSKDDHDQTFRHRVEREDSSPPAGKKCVQ